MQSTFQTIVAVAGMVIAVGGSDRLAVAAASSKTLVFEGKVISIGEIDHPLTPWLVTVRVERVLSGEFSGPTFSFAVHSPAMSGLQKGRSYTVEAAWKDGGYVVDPMQWRRGKRFHAYIGPSDVLP